MERGLVVCLLVVLCLDVCVSFFCCPKAGKCYLCKLPTFRRTVFGPPPITQTVGCKTLQDCSIKQIQVRNSMDQLMQKIRQLRSKEYLGNTEGSKTPRPMKPPVRPDIHKLLGASPHKMNL